MKMKMTENSIKEIGIVNSTIQCIQDTYPFPLDDSWKISDGIKNGKKFEIDGPLYPHGLDVFEDFETDKITLGLSISTCSRMNRKGDYVRYPKEYEMGKACVLEEVLLENLRELKPQLKYFTIDIDDYGLEDDGDNGWEHWMGFVLIPIKSAFEAEEKQKEVDKMDYTIHQIGNVLKILESCNLLSSDDNNREEIKEIQKACEKILERYNGNRFGLEDLKDYFDEETYKKVEEALEGGEETAFELEYGQADGIWHNVIYIITNYEEPKTVTINEDYDKYNPVEMVLEGETRFEILLDPMRCITCVEDHGGIGSYFDKFKPNDGEVETLNKEDLVNKLLNAADIERMEKESWIGPDKSFKENSGHFNDVFLATIWEDDINNFWHAIVDEATKRYLNSVSMKKEEETREEIIDKIVELCEEDTTWDVVEKVCEWLVENSKHIRQHFLDVGDVQVCVNGQIKRTGGIFLYSETDADDTIVDLNTWAYYEKKGQGDNFSKEELKKLYEKLQDNE